MKATVTQSHRKFKVAYRGELNMNEAEPIEDSQDVGQRYRFEHLALRIVLKDLYFSKDAPGPGDQVADFDLPTLGGGHFRSTDLSETGPALLIFGSSTCNVTDRAAPGLRELHAKFGGCIADVECDSSELLRSLIDHHLALLPVTSVVSENPSLRPLAHACRASILRRTDTEKLEGESHACNRGRYSPKISPSTVPSFVETRANVTPCTEKG